MHTMHQWLPPSVQQQLTLTATPLAHLEALISATVAHCSIVFNRLVFSCFSTTQELETQSLQLLLDCTNYSSLLARVVTVFLWPRHSLTHVMGLHSLFLQPEWCLIEGVVNSRTEWVSEWVGEWLTRWIHNEWVRTEWVSVSYWVSEWLTWSWSGRWVVGEWVVE